MKMGLKNWNTLINDQDGGEDGDIKQSTKNTTNSMFGTHLTNFDKIKFIKFGIMLGIIILIIILVPILMSRNDGLMEKQDEVPDDNLTLTLHGTKALVHFDVETKEKRILSQVPNISAYEIYGDHKMFWAKLNSSKIIFTNSDYSQNRNYTFKTKTLFKDERFKARDLAYDHIGNNLYAVDEISEILMVINVETKHHSILLGDLRRPRHIDIDPYHGVMFILQHEHSILKAKMDGTSAKTYYENSRLTTMTIDPRAQRLYWITDDGIGSADYYMKNRLTFHNVFTPHDNIIDLAVVNDNIYLLISWFSLEESGFTSTHDLLSCKINMGLCENHSFDEIGDIGEYGFIKVSHNYAKDNGSVYSPCHTNNGGCQHLCLVVGRSDEKHSCACNLGWQLNADGETCSEAREYMIYTRDTYFRGQLLDFTRNNSVDVFLPTPYKSMESLKVNFDYDQVNDNLYYTTSQGIRSVKLKSNKLNDTVIMGGDRIQDVAYDWMTHNLYYLQNKPDNGHKLRLINVASENRFNKTLVNMPSSDDETSYGMWQYFKKNQANSLAIHPGIGWVFNFNTKTPYHITIGIFRANGTELSKFSDKQIIYDQNDQEKAIAVDYTDQRIYWSLSPYGNEIKYADSYGADIKNISSGFNSKSIFLERSLQIVDMNVHEDWIYLYSSFDIYRVKKSVGGSLQLIKSMPKYSERGGMKIVSEILSKMKASHPCSKRNGGCEQFCFLYENRPICECSDHQQLGAYGHCINKN